MYTVDKESFVGRIKKGIIDEIINIINFYIEKGTNKYNVEVSEEDEETLIYGFNGFSFDFADVSEFIPFKTLMRVKDWDPERRENFLLSGGGCRPCLEAYIQIPFSIHIYSVGDEISLTFREKELHEFTELFKERLDEINNRLLELKKNEVDERDFYIDSMANINLERINEIKKNIADEKYSFEYVDNNKLILDATDVIFWNTSISLDDFLNKVNEKINSYYNGYKNVKFY